MGRYQIRFASSADKDLKYWLKSGNTAVRNKITKIVGELMTHPREGIGKPEMLKGDFAGYWSRRLTKKDRVIYKIEDDIVVVYVLSLRGHYDDT